MVTVPSTKPDNMPTPMTTREVAEFLDKSPETIRLWANADVISSWTAKGKNGRAQRRYFDRGEVEAFSEGGAIAAAAYRERKKLPPTRRGRKVSV